MDTTFKQTNKTVLLHNLMISMIIINVIEFILNKTSILIRVLASPFVKPKFQNYFKLFSIYVH